MASKNQQVAMTALMAANLPAMLGMTQEDLTNAQLLATLGKIGSSVVRDDALTFSGNKFNLPKQYENDIPAAVRYLNQLDDRLNRVNDFYREFQYRPYDVANAMSAAMDKLFGSTGMGEAVKTFFGTTNPSYLTIDVGVNETARIITGRTAFPPLKATIDIGGSNNKELGPLGYLSISAPQRYEAQVEGLFVAIENELKTASIYRGKAITGAVNPGFIDTSRVDPQKVIYTSQVMAQLRANIWTLLDHTQVQRDMGLPLKRSVLIEGPYGSGKSLAAMLTAQRAVANGWTFIQVRPGDDLQMAMRTAVLYAPAVVFYEDIDGVAEKGDPSTVSALLDMFDGIGTKGSEVMVVMTTNFPERIQRGLLRPGRMDAVIHIAEMDDDGYRRLIQAIVPDHLLIQEPAWDKIAEAYKGFLPAFAAEVTQRAVRYAIERTNGKPDYLTTDDFVAAADGMRPQLALMNEAEEGKRTPTMDAVLNNAIRDAVHALEIVDSDYDFATASPAYVMRTPKEPINS